MRVKCLAQEHNTMSPARTQTRTTRSGVDRTKGKGTYFYEGTDKLVALGAHLLPPPPPSSFLRKCSVLRVFKATATRIGGKKIETDVDGMRRGSNWRPPAQKARAH